MDQNVPNACSARQRSQANIGLSSKEADSAPAENLDAATRGTISIKRESSDEEFKEYAETAMNELLGWYGYTNNNKELNRKLAQRLKSNSVIDENDKSDNATSRVRARQLGARRPSVNSSGSESPKSAESCAWCGKNVIDPAGLSSNDAVFCSELCFSQSRRANFKKSKTCDWCKHVRHTVSYVDFQDGASQLQFCSDKCLNQYKMHIFCRETRAHLEMHPHLLTENSTSGLITPDLWMRNCRSPSSRTSSPVYNSLPTPHTEEPQTSPLPLITVAHPSKLLQAAPTEKKDASHLKRKRTRKRSLQKSGDIAQDLRMRRQTHTQSFTETNSNNRDFPELAARLCSNPTVNGSNVIRINGKAPSEVLPALPLNINHNTPPVIPPVLPQPQIQQPRGNILPPVTVMVPYPVVLPVPIPIPIPLPISVFLQAANLRTQTNDSYQANQNGGRVDSDYLNATNNNTSQAKLSSDDEEIVVDDDSRLNVQLTKDHEGPNLEANEENNSFVPMRLRKRKGNENGVLISDTDNYKQKKSLPV